ncbi:proto-oncogene Mas-like [Sphaerodactylus townsendi]|uniref:proto-oncogene Mas-like n=1 Tax=Sphaerodactylus townsendi TaxID=933632 RepID=UPI002025E5B6|nr:proto-oncogene Mas-like [Sphaerodactylus townsendi]
MDTPLEYYNDLHNIIFPNDSIENGHTFDYESKKSLVDNFEILYLLILIINCLLGAVGNGVVIWLLGFRIKRNPFITYILNLAVADLGVLVSATFHAVSFLFVFHDGFHITYTLSLFLFLLMYSASQFLLTAISIDRCVAVFFPLWHKCHQPTCLSSVVCALIWVLSCLLTAITYTSMFTGDGIQFCQFIVNGLLCLPIMTVTTVALFMKLRLKARQHQRRKLLTVVSLTLVFFLFFSFPLNIIFIFNIFFLNYMSKYLTYTAMLLACLNSSVNPAIYTLVGRQRKSRRKESMKMILQNVFKEEEGCTERNPS